jgi:membrane-bound lytic murein transglycosylase MltF
MSVRALTPALTRLLMVAVLVCSGLVNFGMAADAPAKPATTAKPVSPAKPVKAPAPPREELTLEVQNEPWKGDLDGMIERKIIRVLVVPNKTSYYVFKGVQRGATYDLVRAFDDQLNKKLARQKKLGNKHLKVKVIIVPVGREEIAEALTSGRGDIAAAGITITEYGKILADFSLPIYTGMNEVVVSAPGIPAINSPEELSGQEVFVRSVTSYFDALVTLNKSLVAQGKPPAIIKEVSEYLEDEDLVEMVNAGLIPRTIIKLPVAKFWKQVFPKVTINEQAAVRTGGELAWAMRKDSPLLKAAVDDFVKRNRQGTVMGNTLLARYYGQANYVKRAASKAERKKFETLVGYFKKYGDRYDVDWLMMAAQGYQESQLNQQARSPVGAIGVMQVMPDTGKDMRVGDITKLEPNIHAGVKYMRWMIDNYYGDEPMTNLDKALFSFASYNAGAGRISGLRERARKRGLDPNVWFHNVEYIAAERIGAETVTYVSNIFKYYVAYRLIMEERAAKDEAAKDKAAAGEAAKGLAAK